MAEKLSPERAVRLLRAKVAELEALVAGLRADEGKDRLDIMQGYLAADIALIASLLADHMERCNKMEEAYIGAANPGIDLDEVRRRRLRTQPDDTEKLQGDFREGFDEGRPT